MKLWSNLSWEFLYASKTVIEEICKWRAKPVLYFGRSLNRIGMYRTRG